MNKKIFIIFFLLLTVVYGYSGDNSLQIKYKISAKVNKTCTGIYVYRGSKIKLEISGHWKMGHSPGYNTPVDYRGNTKWIPHPNNLPNGALLYYIDDSYNVINETKTIIAQQDGILWFGPNDGRLWDNEGYLNVKISIKDNYTNICVNPYNDNYRSILKNILKSKSDTIIIKGKHVAHILYKNRLNEIKSLREFIKWFDDVYLLQKELSGWDPYDGEPIYYIGVQGFDNASHYMLAGNPIRYNNHALQYLLNIPEDIQHTWGFIHEMGHDFSRVLDNDYMKDGLVEVGANIFTMYVCDMMKIKNNEYESVMSRTKQWWNNGKNLKQLQTDSWYFLGFLMTIKNDYSWEPFKFMYRNGTKEFTYNMQTWSEIWEFWCVMLSMGANTNLTPRFESFGIPVTNRAKKFLKKYSDDKQYEKWIKYFSIQGGL